MREVEHRLDEVDTRRDLAHVVDRTEVAHASHHLDAERDEPLLLLEPRAQLTQLLDDRVDRVLARPVEQETGMEHNDLGARGLCDAGRMVEHPECHVQLLPALGVPHEACDRRVERKRDPVGRGELAELGRRVVVVPELARTEAPRRPSSRRSSKPSTTSLRRVDRAVDRRPEVKLLAHLNDERVVRPTPFLP